MSHRGRGCGAATAGDGTACVLASLRRAAVLRRSAPKSYPPISSIPQTSAARLAEAAEDVADDPNRPKSTTYLYLAYGSNLSAETFLGVRGIRPLSQTNVSVPTLELTFDLAGIPYREPCFANVRPRKIPDKPKLPDPTNPPQVPPFDPPPVRPPHHNEAGWGQGLVGVVYEVTEEDYRTFIRTEGGGASYHEIPVLCMPIPPKISVPEKPPIPEIPKPFLARTLYAPRVPDEDLPDDPNKKKWWYHFVKGPQRDPDYAQASARYLKLITDGAKEHDLPDEYQRWLNSLQPYTITSCRQKIGAFIFTLTWGFFFLLMITLSKQLADENGKLPKWMAMSMLVLFTLTWDSYDMIFKPLFGNGERTEEEDDKSDQWLRRRSSCTMDEEKAALLSDYE